MIVMLVDELSHLLLCHFSKEPVLKIMGIVAVLFDKGNPSSFF
jgi:hypothetical protein